MPRQQSPGAVLRAKLAERRALLVPGAANALGASIVADLGFEAVYLSGAGVPSAPATRAVWRRPRPATTPPPAAP